MKIRGFDWDNGNLLKCEKHGVKRLVIEKLFKMKAVFISPDLKHSDFEQRYIAVGRADNNKPIFVAFTLRHSIDGILIRPITARFMHTKEIKKYEEAFE
jgi:uncharacterized DUF497 family protein